MVNTITHVYSPILQSPDIKKIDTKLPKIIPVLHFLHDLQSFSSMKLIRNTSEMLKSEHFLFDLTPFVYLSLFHLNGNPLILIIQSFCNSVSWYFQILRNLWWHEGQLMRMIGICGFDSWPSKPPHSNLITCQHPLPAAHKTPNHHP